MGTRQLVVFTINSEEFGIEIDRINSIEKMLDIFKIPNTPDYIEGLVNLRGKVHTVFNLRKRFNMECPEFDENNKIIMANTSSSIVGIIVDEVKEIVKIEESDFEAAPQSLSNLKDKYLDGIAKIGPRIIMLLDLEKVLEADEVTETMVKANKA